MSEHPDQQGQREGGTDRDVSAGRRRAPTQLVLVRHGQSMGNLADAAAREKGLGRLELDTRDADTPLSEDGEGQARAVRSLIEGLEGETRPQVVLSSPYVRAAETARISLEGTGLVPVLDERLRERDLGALDGLTGKGIRETMPEEAARRDHVGKFYYRPLGGESWTDVIFRVRSILTDIRAEYHDEVVWVFSHQAVIMAFRYVLEGMDESEVLGTDKDTPLPNCSVTRYVRGEGGALELDVYAETTHIEQSGSPTTRETPHGQGDRDD
ncbi:MAG: histidine phosphatase family protein [Micrococcales bacterium]|nr:histidine phosphatase family protein [Micrococcales bacterium]